MEVVDVSDRDLVKKLVDTTHNKRYITVNGYLFPGPHKPYMQRLIDFEVS